MRAPGDIHTHVWLAEHMSDEFKADLFRTWGRVLDPTADYAMHGVHLETVGRAIVLAFDAPAVGLVVPNEFVANYVKTDPRRLVGFASVDPQRPDWRERLEFAIDGLGMRGIKVGPVYQAFDPLSERAMDYFEWVNQRRLPIMWHQGATFLSKAPLRFANPVVVDDVAIRFPELRIVIAHLGHPWIGETVAVIRKQPNVYADISALASRPEQFRNALTLAWEYNCVDKLLFGTDFPFDRGEQLLALMQTWIDDPASPPPLTEAVRKITRRDPLAVLGF